VQQSVLECPVSPASPIHSLGKEDLWELVERVAVCVVRLLRRHGFDRDDEDVTTSVDRRGPLRVRAAIVNPAVAKLNPASILRHRSQGDSGARGSRWERLGVAWRASGAVESGGDRGRTGAFMGDGGGLGTK